MITCLSDPHPPQKKKLHGGFGFDARNWNLFFLFISFNWDKIASIYGILLARNSTSPFGNTNGEKKRI